MVVAEPQRTQMLKGLLDPCLLAVIEQRETYGYEILARLTEAGLGDVAEGSVYPALMRLERAGLIESWRVPSESGPPRKYYRLSPLGVEVLVSWRGEWFALSDSVTRVLGGQPQHRKETA